MKNSIIDEWCWMKNWIGNVIYGIVLKRHDVMIEGYDLQNKSRVRVRAYIFCKSPRQTRIYSLTWAHKIYFSRDEVSSHPEKKLSME